MNEKKKPQGLGLWIAFPTMLGLSWAVIAKLARALGAHWLAVRTTDPSLKGAALEKAISAVQAEGLGFYGWHYSYPDENRVVTQVEHMIRCYASGADGHIVNAEIEFTGKRAEATRLGAAIRKALPDWYVAHAPLGWISYHPTWPYEEFAAWCDDVHPQMYWTELKHGLYSKEFRAQIELWKSGHRHGGADDQGIFPDDKRICLIGCTYGKGDLKNTKQPPGVWLENDLRTFLHEDTLTMPCTSLYSLEVATDACKALLEKEWGSGKQSG